MTKILIVEGVDLVGKSTAIERISKTLKTGITIKNNYKPKSQSNFEIYNQYLEIMTMTGHYRKLIILDRFYPSQLVYSYLRGFDELEQTPEIAQVIEKDLHFYKTKLLLLDTSEEELRKRYAVRGDEHVDINQILVIRQRYLDFFDRCQLDKLKIDSMDPDFIQKVQRFARW